MHGTIELGYSPEEFFLYNGKIKNLCSFFCIRSSGFINAPFFDQSLLADDCPFCKRLFRDPIELCKRSKVIYCFFFNCKIKKLCNSF